MQTILNELQPIVEEIDQGFKKPRYIDETELERYIENYFFKAFSNKFPIIDIKIKRAISILIHPDKLNSPHSVLKKYKSFVETHPQFISIPMKALEKIPVSEAPKIDKKPIDTAEIIEENAFREKIAKSSWFLENYDRISTKASRSLLSNSYRSVYLTEQELLNRMRFMDIREFAGTKFGYYVDLSFYFNGVVNPNLSARLEQYFFSNDSISAKHFNQVFPKPDNADFRESFLKNIKDFCQKNTSRFTFLQQKVFSKHINGVIQPNTDWISDLVIFNEKTLENIKVKLPYLGQFIFYLDKFIKTLFKLTIFVSIELPYFLLVSIPKTIHSFISLLLVDINRLFSMHTNYLKIVMDDLWKKYYSEEQLNSPIITNEPRLIYDSSIYSFCQTWLFLQSYKIGLSVDDYQSIEDLVKTFDEYYDKDKNTNSSLNNFETKFFKYFVNIYSSFLFLNLLTTKFGFGMSIDLLKEQNFGLKSLLRALVIPIAFCLKLTIQVIETSINLIKDFLIFLFYAASTVALSVFWVAPSMLYNSIAALCCSNQELKQDNLKLITFQG